MPGPPALSGRKTRGPGMPALQFDFAQPLNTNLHEFFKSIREDLC
jgi:hypothetical protein